MSNRTATEKDLKGIKRVLYRIFVKDFRFKLLALALAAAVWLIAAGLSAPV